MMSTQASRGRLSARTATIAVSLTMLLLLGGAQYVRAGMQRNTGGDGPHERATTAGGPTGSIVGTVRDSVNGEPLGWTNVLIVELNQFAAAHEDGEFHFHSVPAGGYTLRAFRLGYRTLSYSVQVPAGDSVRVALTMTSTAFETSGVVVEADRQRTNAIVHPADQVSGSRLQQLLGRTLAETIDNEPGVSQRTMGSAPARPVMRGLGGDRLLILEDGESTGDMSSTSPDHALAIDPMNAERIEIIRGPGSLVYGSNTIGGVINVARGEVPAVQPDHAHGAASMQGESVNSGLSGGINVSAPLGPFAFRIDGSTRGAGDISTPAGMLANTAMHARTASGGASVILPWLVAGGAASTYQTDYGIPGGFVGGHPHGVDISMTRSQYMGRAEILPGDAFVRRIEMEGSYSRYYHEEREAPGIVGTRFGLLTAAGLARVHHEDVGPLLHGTLGMQGDWKYFAAAGLSETPATVESGIAAYAYEEAAFGDLTLQLSLRGDARTVAPDSSSANSAIGFIRERSFSSLSGGVMAEYALGHSISVSLAVMRTSRAPGIDELFSQGPHLAAFSFEVGNPELKTEHGLGIDLGARYEGGEHRAQVTLFRTTFDGYIFPRNTGRLNYRLLLPIFQYTGANAEMLGAEATAEWLFGKGWSGSLTASYVRGELTDTGEPLPLIPPLSGKAALRWTHGAFTLGASVRAAAAQDRTGEFEQPTAGYVVYDALAQYQFETGHLFHSLVLTAENLADTEYRMHLSRVKSIMPEPGRNVRLLYRMFF